MTYRDHEWKNYAQLLGYKTEIDFWNKEYKDSPQGCDSISKKIRKIDCLGPTWIAIRARLIKLGYKIKSKGGDSTWKKKQRL